MPTVMSLMKRTAQLAATCAMLAAAVGCQEKVELRYSEQLEKVHTVAVLPFVDAPGNHAKGSGRVVVNEVITQLYELPEIRVVERSRLAAIIKEKDFQDLVDPSKASEIGKLTGADMVILGNVPQYDAQQDYGHIAVYVVSGGSTKYTHRVGLSIRAVLVDTGRVVYSGSGQGSDSEGYTKAAQIAASRALRKLKLFYEQTRSPKE